MFKKILIVIAVGLGLKFVIHLAVTSKLEQMSDTKVDQAQVDEIVAANAKKTRDQLNREVAAAENQSARKITQKELESLMIALNKTYPKMTSLETRLDKATVGPMILTFHKTMVNKRADDFEITPQNSAKYTSVLLEDSCSNAGVRLYLRQGVSVKVIQRDMQGKLIFEFMTRPGDCPAEGA